MFLKTEFGVSEFQR